MNDIRLVKQEDLWADIFAQRKSLLQVPELLRSSSGWLHSQTQTPGAGTSKTKQTFSESDYDSVSSGIWQTNYKLSKPQRETLGTLLNQALGDIADVNNDLVSVEQDICRIQTGMDILLSRMHFLLDEQLDITKERALRQRRADRCRGLLAPSRPLPLEILAIIFKYVVDATASWTPEDYRGRIGFSCVNSSWRQVALATSSAWDNKCFRLEHKKDVSASFTFLGGGELPLVTTLRAISPFRSNISILYLHKIAFGDFLRLPPHGFPALRYLSISNANVKREADITTAVFDGAINLRELKINMGFIHGIFLRLFLLNVPWHQITHLNFEEPVSPMIMDLLPAAINLEQASITIEKSPRMEEEKETDTETISDLWKVTFAALSCLELSMPGDDLDPLDKFFSRARFPNLTTFKLVCYYEHNYTNIPLSFIFDLLKPSLQLLRAITITPIFRSIRGFLRRLMECTALVDLGPYWQNSRSSPANHLLSRMQTLQHEETTRTDSTSMKKFPRLPVFTVTISCNEAEMNDQATAFTDLILLWMSDRERRISLKEVGLNMFVSGTSLHNIVNMVHGRLTPWTQGEGRTSGFRLKTDILPNWRGHTYERHNLLRQGYIPKTSLQASS